MPDRSMQDKPISDDMPGAEWRTAVPGLNVRWLVGVAVIVPFLLAAGVYWLRHAPAGPAMTTADSVVEVQIIPLHDHAAPVRDAALPSNQTTLLPRSEPLVEDRNRSIPEETLIAPASTQPDPTPAPAPAAVQSVPDTSAQRPAPRTAAAFQQALLQHIARFRYYPDQARRDRIQGIVQLVFAMERDGTVRDIWVRASSGSSILDSAAIETVRDAQPLPRIPADLPDQLNVLIPVAFALP
jgi:periplasmic protein TonB